MKTLCRILAFPFILSGILICTTGLGLVALGLIIKDTNLNKIKEYANPE